MRFARGFVYLVAVDRVVHHAVILELPIPSYRAQAAKARTQAASEPVRA